VFGLPGCGECGEFHFNGDAAAALAVIVSVAEPDPPVTMLGIEQVTLARLAATEQINATLPANAWRGLTLSVAVADVPADKLRVAGLDVTAKSGGMGTFKGVIREWLWVPDTPVIIIE